MPSLITLASGAPAATTAATGVTSYAWLLLAFPLLGAAVLLFGGKALDKVGPVFAVLMSWAACVVGVLIVISMLGADAADRLTHSGAIWVNATSLGGVESTWERRRRWSSELATVPENLVRMSVGIEDLEDLWRDLQQAFEA